MTTKEAFMTFDPDGQPLIAAETADLARKDTELVYRHSWAILELVGWKCSRVRIEVIENGRAETLQGD